MTPWLEYDASKLLYIRIGRKRELALLIVAAASIYAAFRIGDAYLQANDLLVGVFGQSPFRTRMHHPMFKPSACGPQGSSQLYELPWGERMSEGGICFGSRETADRYLHDLIRSATRIIELRPRAKNRFGQEGERLVMLYKSDETPGERGQIVWCGGACCSYIEAPSPDVALAFEREQRDDP